MKPLGSLSLFLLVSLVHDSWNAHITLTHRFPNGTVFTETVYECIPGYKCTDIDECSTGLENCHERADCINTEGSYSCKCQEGYTGNGFSCEDVDECRTGLENCDEHADCMNTEGSYHCKCPDGYTGDGFSCEDIDECSTGLENCDGHADCINREGSYHCRCQDGYTGNGFSCEEVPDSVCQPENKLFVCEKNGYFRNPNHCGQFFACQDVGTPWERLQLLDCPNLRSLIFDERRTRCVWPWQVGVDVDKMCRCQRASDKSLYNKDTV